MYRFIESIRILNGQVAHLNYHTARMNATRRHFYRHSQPIDLQPLITVPSTYKDQLVKCRVIYNENIENITFHAYQIRPVGSLKIVKHADIDYTFKYENRNALNQLFERRETCDDILIVKDRYITDTFYANVVFEKGKNFYTPKKPLLKGVQRQYLLDHKKIKEKNISMDDINDFDQIHLVNAMMKLGECVVETSNVEF